MTKYSYEGPVISFERCITNNWSSTTYAISEKKARSNLAFQYKKTNNMCAGTKIALPGKLITEQA